MQRKNLSLENRCPRPSWRIAILLLLFSGAFAEDPGFHDNVVIVLDASGSMEGAMPGCRTKMLAAKLALKEVLRRLPPTTRVGLVVFSAMGLKDPWVQPLGSSGDNAALERVIDGLQPHGGTPLGAYMKIGADRLLEERARLFGYGTFRLLVVTDGEAEDQELVDRFTPDVMSRGITLDVIGVGMRGAHTLARRVHSYRAANDPAALRQALAEVLAEVGGGDNEASEDAFAVIAPLPAELAAAALRALSVFRNQPIGGIEPPGRDVAVQDNPPSSLPIQRVPVEEKVFLKYHKLIVAAFVFIIVLIGLLKRKT